MELMVTTIFLIAGLILIAIGCVLLSEARMYTNIDRLETESTDIRDSASEVFSFIGGLPIPENTQVRLFFGLNKIILVYGCQEFNLRYKKINDIYYVENIDTCDLTDAITLSAFNLQANKPYLVIEYDFGSGVEPIVLEAQNNPDFCKKVADSFSRPYLKPCASKPV